MQPVNQNGLIQISRAQCEAGRADARVEPSDPRAPQALACLSGYYQDLDARFPGGFDVSTSRDPDASALRAPLGTFLLLWIGDAAVGCSGIKGDGSEIAELKRFWIAPPARRLGLAHLLLEQSENQARGLGVKTLRLDTNATLTEAIALYRTSGYVEIPAFADEPYAQHWFEKHL